MNKNIYEKHNKQLFAELLQITINKPIHYANIIRGKKYLITWINDIVIQLTDKKYDIRTKVYWILNGLTDFPTCKNCGKKFNDRNIRNLKIGYGIFCSNKCANNNIEHNKKILNTREKHKNDDPLFLDKIDKKIKSTKLQRYGNENYTNREKAKQTCLDKYGTDWFVQTDEFKQKSANTCIKHYGVNCSFKSIKCRQKAKDTCKKIYNDENYTNREKAKQTCLDKYGVDNPAKCPEIYEKIRQTFIENYGADHNMKSEKGYAEWQNGIMKIYGVKHNWQIPEVKEHIKQTNIKLYGTPIPSTCKYMFDGIAFDSSWELAYYIWLKDNQIKFEYHTISILYKDSNNIEHTYYPDFKLIDENKIVEIKGPHLIDIETGKLIDFYGNGNNQDIYDSKMKCMIENNVMILSTNELMPIFKYITEKYGGIQYLKQFKHKIKKRSK